ncbi:TIMELESS-interacting protein [Achroia grisella]|uniref:TIMELESS-interacting protein n=1 Tax=Achroia grisella TaxID=688607 RepID=UPI0027D1EFE9|nr:TIMELESS-interacting protein [Achroia grisella]
MSLLEDVFLEDEAGEAQDLERVIEGDEYDDRPQSVYRDSDSNSEKEDEAVEDRRRVDPTQNKTKRVIKNPRFLLNPARLTGPRGIQVIPEHFKDFKFKGKGHEKEDLDLVLKKLEHWAYRLYPKFEFEDCLKKIEMLGKKRPVMVHLHKIRSDQFTTEETVVQKDSSDEDTPVVQEEDEFDKLLQQQIELARSTPASSSVKSFSTPKVIDKTPRMMPKAVSSPSITNEQKERMLQNRRLAEERRLARIQNNTNKSDGTINTETIIVEDHVNSNITKDPDDNNEIVVVENYFANERIAEDEPRRKKHNRSNVIDSSDDECEEVAVNKSITVDVHEQNMDIVSNSKICAKDSIDLTNSNTTNNEVDDYNTVTNNSIHDTVERDDETAIATVTKAKDSGITEENDNIENEVSGMDDDSNSGIVDENSVKPIEGDKIRISNDNLDEEINQDSEYINSENNVKEKSINNVKENVPNNDVEEFMDVDFSDDF